MNPGRAGSGYFAFPPPLLLPAPSHHLGVRCTNRLIETEVNARLNLELTQKHYYGEWRCAFKFNKFYI